MSLSNDNIPQQSAMSMSDISRIHVQMCPIFLELKMYQTLEGTYVHCFDTYGTHGKFKENNLDTRLSLVWIGYCYSCHIMIFFKLPSQRAHFMLYPCPMFISKLLRILSFWHSIEFLLFIKK